MQRRSTRMRLAVLLSDPSARLDVYRTVRRAFKGVKALCAATVSEYLIRAGVLHGYRPWTAQLENALREKGWITVIYSETEVPSPAQASLARQRARPSVAQRSSAKPLDLCYSIDANRNSAPDHVFIFIRWLDRERLVAEVVDNYSAHPHPRNLGAPCWHGGRRLAYGCFSHAQRAPVQ
ncbi:MAG: hypothetical protein M3R04_01035 [bacterium]|nr:hypothetical protein [bacterium]